MSKGKSKKPTAGNQPTTEGKMSEKAYAKELKDCMLNWSHCNSGSSTRD